jgi:hypothetical protein
MTKPIRLRIFGRIQYDGSQVVAFVIYSRTKNMKYGLSLMLSSDERNNRQMIGDALRRLRASWRDAVLGEGWQYRSAMRRFRQREREHQLADLLFLAAGLGGEA